MSARPDAYFLVAKSHLAETLGRASFLEEKMQSLKAETERREQEQEKTMAEQVRALEATRAAETVEASESYEHVVTQTAGSTRTFGDI